MFLHRFLYTVWFINAEAKAYPRTRLNWDNLRRHCRSVLHVRVSSACKFQNTPFCLGFRNLMEFCVVFPLLGSIPRFPSDSFNQVFIFVIEHSE